MTSHYSVQAGEAYPLGATCREGGVNFAIFSANAEKIELCLYDELGQLEVARISLPECTDQVWHGFIEGLGEGALYGFRVSGPYDPGSGHRFNPHKLVLDPYAKKIDGDFRWSPSLYGYDAGNPHKDLVMDTRDSGKLMPKCVVVDTHAWGDFDTYCAQQPKKPWNQSLIYETHVKGFTQLNLKVPANQRGTFSGLTHPAVLDYVAGLGVTAIELMPVQGFVDEHFLVAQGLSNYWGYNTLQFFAPHQGYMSTDNPLEFREMVKTLHEWGLEVILDVVYNHTAEGNHLGPTLSFRGIDNASYYCLQADNARYYANDTGCGNTLNVKHPRVLQMITDSLRFWVQVMGVDGFRFDLATVLGREAQGFDPSSGFFDVLRQDPILCQTKLIAEPWDIGPGGYQLGSYPAGWAEWNDRYRDTCRRFWRGEHGMLPEFARRIHGSSDLFEHSGRSPHASINFICSHDGFTLNDLVSYSERHNLANKEQNKDGHHANFSDNHGEEGDSDDPYIVTLRERQCRNLIATLLLSQGTPMLLSGDECGRSQFGNNNAYCQDNEISWVDWQALIPAESALALFTKNVTALRMRHELLISRFYIHRPKESKQSAGCSVRWLHCSGEEMQECHWKQQNLQSVGWVLEQNCHSSYKENRKRLLILFNAGNEAVEFSLPSDDLFSQWFVRMDTAMSDGIPLDAEIDTEAPINLIAKSIKLLEAIA